jgi:hypothetical protein
MKADGTGADVGAWAAWRDVDGDRRSFGLRIYSTGASLNVGRRLYRIRWAYR